MTTPAKSANQASESAQFKSDLKANETASDKLDRELNTPLVNLEDKDPVKLFRNRLSLLSKVLSVLKVIGLDSRELSNAEILMTEVFDSVEDFEVNLRLQDLTELQIVELEQEFDMNELQKAELRAFGSEAKAARVVARRQAEESALADIKAKAKAEAVKNAESKALTAEEAETKERMISADSAKSTQTVVK